MTDRQVGSRGDGGSNALSWETERVAVGGHTGVCHRETDGGCVCGGGLEAA